MHRKEREMRRREVEKNSSEGKEIRKDSKRADYQKEMKREKERTRNKRNVGKKSKANRKIGK